MSEVARSTVAGADAPPARENQDGDHVYFHSGATPSYRKVHQAPSQTTPFTSIPIIDLGALADPSSSSARQALAAELATACRTVGFFYITNHGIPSAVITKTFAVLRRFFALDLDTKMGAHVHKNPAIRGYEPRGETRLDPRTTGDIKEAFTMGDCALEPEQDYLGTTGRQPPPHITRPQNIWPADAPWWREGLYEYYSHIFPLARKLIPILALALGLDETGLDHLFTFPITGLRALYYPSAPSPSSSFQSPSTSFGHIGLGAHADFSWLTLVLQDSVPALEVLNPAGAWVDAPPIKNTLVCNVGQYLERQTGGAWPATVHRVRNRSGRERYSLPFFLTMDPDAEVGVLDGFRGEQEGNGEKGEGKGDETMSVGDLYIRRVLPARPKHPTSVRYRDVPQEEWTYGMLLA